MNPVATIFIGPQQALVTSHTSSLPNGSHKCYSEAQIQYLLAKIAELERKLKK